MNGDKSVSDLRKLSSICTPSNGILRIRRHRSCRHILRNLCSVVRATLETIAGDSERHRGLVVASSHVPQAFGQQLLVERFGTCRRFALLQHDHRAAYQAVVIAYLVSFDLVRALPIENVVDATLCVGLQHRDSAFRRQGARA
ncbi:MAG TPA: hypothetical protein DIW86_10925 [Pseudomonas sp.]|nr:hypothetical protein [Pseudomonas sp.]